MTILLYFDGACEPNPGLGSWGWCLMDGEQRLADGRGVRPSSTNNEMEYFALGHGLRAVLDRSLKPDMLEIRGDSKLVICQLTGKWACKAAHLGKLLDRCHALLDEIGSMWLARWVPRDQNTMADELSVRAWTEHMGRPFPERRRKVK